MKQLILLSLVLTTTAGYSQTNWTKKIKPKNQFDIAMVYVQGGSFNMGCSSQQETACRESDIPIHNVKLNDFEIGKYEVTQSQWVTIMGNNPSQMKGDNLPVTDISWVDIQEFIKRLNGRTGKNYRLPTEAEWEYAARGGNKSRGYKYSGSNIVADVAWTTENANKKTHTVGTKAPNELGIYDMSGNVEELCNDWIADDYYSNSPKENPTGPVEGVSKVLRGGSYLYSFELGLYKVYVRWGASRYNRLSDMGFRLAHSL